MKRPITILLSFIFLPALIFGQTVLFNTEVPLDMKMSISVKAIKKTKGDSLYTAHKLYFRNDAGAFDSIKVGLKGRGNSRMQICYFPPLWMKVDKKQAKGTLFEGNKKLKLVLPCYDDKESNELIMREYLCYKLYEVVTPYHFKTRLVNIELTQVGKKKKSTYQQKGIFLEDADKTAKRFDATLVDVKKLHSSALHDTTAFMYDLFQYMISNTDWSKEYQHNTKLMYHKQSVVAIPYDFDMSGLVNAPYAVVSNVGGDEPPISSVVERYYKGLCQSKEVTDHVRKEFLSKEEQFLLVLDKLKGQLPDKKIKQIKGYLDEFFDVLKSDNLFGSKIIYNCREIY